MIPIDITKPKLKSKIYQVQNSISKFNYCYDQDFNYNHNYDYDGCATDGIPNGMPNESPNEGSKDGYGISPLTFQTWSLLSIIVLTSPVIILT